MSPEEVKLKHKISDKIITMKFGIRTPSLKRRISARTSLKRVVRHRVGLKMPRGTGMLTNPKKALYNKVYNKTSISVDRLAKKANSKTKKKTTSYEWNTGNFKTRNEMLKKAKEKNIKTNRRVVCKRCDSDLWSIVPMRVLFMDSEAVFCQNCAKPGESVKEFIKLRNNE